MSKPKLRKLWCNYKSFTYNTQTGLFVGLEHLLWQVLFSMNSPAASEISCGYEVADAMKYLLCKYEGEFYFTFCRKTKYFMIVRLFHIAQQYFIRSGLNIDDTLLLFTVTDELRTEKALMMTKFLKNKSTESMPCWSFCKFYNRLSHFRRREYFIKDCINLLITDWWPIVRRKQ